jgi:hypothetical protein
VMKVKYIQSKIGCSIENSASHPTDATTTK